MKEELLNRIEEQVKLEMVKVAESLGFYEQLSNLWVMIALLNKSSKSRHCPI